MIEGKATKSGTAEYHAKHKLPSHSRVVGGLTFPSIGLGTYLGEMDEKTSLGYQSTIQHALESGFNLVDCATNYRHQLSERDAGIAIGKFIKAGGKREEIILTSKAGFYHGDGGTRQNPDVVHGEWFVEGASSCFEPGFIRAQVERSRKNLNLETIDVYFLHNPESILAADPVGGYAIIEAAFVELEKLCKEGKIQIYGVATWNGLRQPAHEPGHLQLVKLVHHAGAAARIAGAERADAHRFKAIELPINLAMVESYLSPNQPWKFGDHTTLQAARDLEMVVIGSAPLLEAKLLGRVPTEWRQALDQNSDAECLLQFARSVKGVTTSIIGCSQMKHLEVALRLAKLHAPNPGVVTTLLGPGGPHG